MIRAAALLFTVALGCIGPVLRLPDGEPTGAHEWLCVKRACPAEAQAIGGVVKRVGYDRTAMLCNCDLEDERHLPVFKQVPPHPPRGSR